MNRQLEKTYAPIHPVFFKKNMFMNLKKGDKRNISGSIDTVFQGRQLKIRYGQRLSYEDLSVLLALIEIGALSDPDVWDYTTIKQAHQNEILEDELAVFFTKFRTSKYDVIDRAGLNDFGGKGYEALQEIFDRLSQVDYVDYGLANGQNSRFFKVGIDHKLLGIQMVEDQIEVRLNPMLTKAIIGREGSVFNKIDMEEFTSLNKGTRIVYQQLSTLLSSRHSTEIGLDTMVEGVYPPHEGKKPIARSTLSMRRKKVRESLDEIAEKLGWVMKTSIGRDKKLIYHISK